MAFSVSASPLSCECGQVTISATDIQGTPPSRWGVFLFYMALKNITPFYSGVIYGNTGNPQTDVSWNVRLPMNADFLFFSFAIAPYNGSTTYGLNDWVFNPDDGRIYISLNAGNTSQNLFAGYWWRQFNSNDISQYVPLKTSNVASDTLEVAGIDQNVTCNTTFAGLLLNICISNETSIQTLVLQDKTGLFDFQCNPNGYGAINPSRGQQAAFAVLSNTDSSGLTTLYYPRSYAYLGAYRYYYDIPRDGVYTQTIFLTAVLGDAPYYNMNVIVFDVASNSFYKSLINNNTDPATVTASWLPINSYADFATGVVNGTQIGSFIQSANGDKTVYDIMQGYKASCPCGINSKCGDDLILRAMKIQLLIQAANTDACLLRFADAQCKLEKIPRNCAPYVSKISC